MWTPAASGGGADDKEGGFNMDGFINSVIVAVGVLWVALVAYKVLTIPFEFFFAAGFRW